MFSRLFQLPFAKISKVGVNDSRKDTGFVIRYIAPKLLMAAIMGHQEREKMIMQSGLKWTIVHAPALTNDAPTKKYRTGENLKTKAIVTTIFRTDVADFMLNQLTDEKYVNKVVRIMQQKQ